MRVGIDLSYLVPGRARGHQRFCEGLLTGWAELSSFGQLGWDPLLISSIECRPLFERFGFAFAPVQISAQSPVRRVLDQNRLLPSLCRRQGLDLLYCPGNSGPLLAGVPLVVTLQDLHHRRYPQRYPWLRKMFFRVLAEPSYQRAVRLVVPSSFVAKQAKEYLSLDSSIVPLSPQLTPAGGNVAFAFDNASSPAPFVSVSAAIPHKNVDLLLQAFVRYRTLGGRRGLVLVGPHRTTFKVEGLTVLDDIDDVQLQRLYASSAGLVSASEYEGFGLPLAEALAQGCPVIAPKLASIPEVLGSEGTYFERLEPVTMARDLLSFENKSRLPLGSGPFGQRKWRDVGDEYSKIFALAGSR